MFTDLRKELSGINGVGSDLIPTKNTSPGELNAITIALNDCISEKRNLLEKQDFATCGKSVFRLDSPRHKPTYEIQRNGPKAQGEQTTLACVKTNDKIQDLINSFPNNINKQLQEAYNKILWEKLKKSLEEKKNMNVTLADLEGANKKETKILAEFENSFR
jgi:hypothetical protein